MTDQPRSTSGKSILNPDGSTPEWARQQLLLETAIMPSDPRPTLDRTYADGLRRGAEIALSTARECAGSCDVARQTDALALHDAARQMEDEAVADGPCLSAVIKKRDEEIRGLRNRMQRIEMDARLGRARALDTKAGGGTPADAMALTLFYALWKVPQNHGDEFASEYFWSLQRDIVDNLAGAAAAVGARIVWDDSSTREGADG